MRREVQSELAAARELLLSAQEDDAPPPNLETFEDVAQALLFRFKETNDTRLFEAFYRVTANLFAAYAIKVLKKLRANVEVMNVTNRLYAILFEKLIMPEEEVPLDYLLPWCYRVINNVAREEKRKTTYRSAPICDPTEDRARESTVDKVIRREEEQNNGRLLQRVLEILHSGEAGFSERDREVMRLFYLKRLSLREIGEKTELKQSHVGVILKRARDKIARIVRTQP